MNDENKNQITYDENWQSVSSAEYPQTYSDDEIEEYSVGNAPLCRSSEMKQPKKPKKKSDSPKQLLITFQLLICLIIALAAFVLKNIGGELYSAARELYYTQLNDTAIFDGDGGTSLPEVFSATKDEA